MWITRCVWSAIIDQRPSISDHCPLKFSAPFSGPFGSSFKALSLLFYCSFLVPFDSPFSPPLLAFVPGEPVERSALSPFYTELIPPFCFFGLALSFRVQMYTFDSRRPEPSQGPFKRILQHDKL